MTPLKSAETRVSVEATQQAIVKLLRKYEARGFGFDEDPETQMASVRFAFPSHGGNLLPVEIRVPVTAVYSKLYPKKSYEYRGDNAPRIAQAHRTAWRLLFDWLDAALNTVAMGAQSAEDVFLAHSFVRVADGSMVRMKDYAARAIAGGSLPLLGSGV